MEFKIKWSETLERWQYSTNAGGTWTPLHSDNPNDSSEAIDEAAEETGVSTNRWDFD